MLPLRFNSWYHVHYCIEAFSNSNDMNYLHKAMVLLSSKTDFWAYKNENIQNSPFSCLVRLTSCVEKGV